MQHDKFSEIKQKVQLQRELLKFLKQYAHYILKK